MLVAERPLIDTPTSVATARTKNVALTYGVFLKGDVADKKLERTLCGKYIEKGKSQGKRFFLKLKSNTPEMDAVHQFDVFLYYWDDRDGPDCAGWWFGNKLGGTQVWAHCKEHTELPPQSGWHVPWDGPVCEGFVVLEREAAKRHLQAEAELKKKDEVTKQKSEAKQKLIDAQKEKREFKIKERKRKENEAMEAMAMEMLKEVEVAEDMVEKSATAVGIVRRAFLEEGEALEVDIAHADNNVKTAARMITEANVAADNKLLALKRLGQEPVAQGTLKLEKLKERLLQAKEVLEPLSNVREESDQKIAAKKLLAELMDKTAEVELALDDAEGAASMCEASGDTTQGMPAVSKAREMVSSANNFFGKKTEAELLSGEERLTLEQRSQETTKRLKKVEESLKKTEQKAALEVLVSSVDGKLQEVTESLKKVETATGPLLTGETLEHEAILAVARDSEEAARSAELIFSSAKKVMASKMLEARRFPDELKTGPMARLQEREAEIEEAAKRLKELRRTATEGKRSTNFLQTRNAVEHMEVLAEKTANAAEIIAVDSALLSLSAEEVKAATEAIGKAEEEANVALVDAQKSLTARQMESRGSDTPKEARAELADFQSRISRACVKVAKQRKLVDSMDHRTSCQRVLKEADEKLQQIEEKVANIASVTEKLDAAISAAGEPRNEKQPSPESAEQSDKPATEESAEQSDKPATEENAEQSEKPATEETLQACEEKQHQLIRDQASLLKAGEEASVDAHTSVKEVDRFLSLQALTLGTGTQDIAKLSSRARKASDRIFALEKTLKARSEDIIVPLMIVECKDRAREAADSMRKTTEAELLFQNGIDKLLCKDVMKNFTAFHSATQQASTLVGNTKTYLAMKRLAVKKMTAAAVKQTLGPFAELQESLDASGKKLHELRGAMPARHKAAVELEVSGLVAAARQQVELAKQETEALSNATDTLSAEDMQTTCAKVDTAQKKAKSVVSGALKLLEKRRHDASKTSENDESTPLLQEQALCETLSEFQKSLETLQTEFGKLGASLTRSEHRFVANALVKEADDLVKGLETKMDGAIELAAKLVADPWQDFAAAIALVEFFAALRRHCEATSESPKDSFLALLKQDMLGDCTDTENQFSIFVKKLSADSALGIPEYSQDHLVAMQAELIGRRGEATLEEACLRLYDRRYRCTTPTTITESLSVKKTKTIRKLDLDELVIALGEPTKDDVGLMRVTAIAEKDNAKGWISISGNQGKVFLQQCTPYDDHLRQVASTMQDLQQTAISVGQFLAEKASNLKPVRSGPLLEAKGELTKVLGRVTEVNSKMKDLRTRISASKTKHSEHTVSEKARHREGRERITAGKTLSETNLLVQQAEEQVQESLSAAEDFLAPKADEADTEARKKTAAEIQKRLEDVLQTVAKASSSVQEKLNSLKSATKGPLAEAKGSIVKLSVRLGSTEIKCKRLYEDVKKIGAS